MSKVTNRDKKPVIDESVLDEVPPNINEPIVKEDETPENLDPNPDPVVEPKKEPKEEPKPSEPIPSEPIPSETKPSKPAPESPPLKPRAVSDEETQEQKDQRYKAQQAETQIQAEKNKDLISKIDQASQLPEPTEQELRDYVKSKGSDWDELTVFEQAMAKDTLLSNRRFSLVNEAVQTTKKIDEWANRVDSFIDATDGKPEFVKLSGHEAEFRKFAMKEAHRGVAIDSLLLPAFLSTLPEPKKVRGSLFEDKGGGESPDKNVGKITDADTNRTLRETNPREWRRQVKAGNIKIEE